MPARSGTDCEICEMMPFLFLAILISLIAPTSEAQTGVITGRVIAEDGGDVSNVSVSIHPAYTGQRDAGSPLSATTDESGNFKFTGLKPRAYRIYARETRGYVNPFTPGSGTDYYRIGDHAVITVIRGGVITGRVTTANGEPLVSAQVRATMTRDAEGNSLRRGYGGRSRTTDDRGVYRLYGLAPGTYIVSVRSNLSIRQISPYDGDMPTYYPSSTRDTAVEVAVVSGGEVASVDIRYRSDRGHVISGVVTGPDGGSQRHVSLYNIATGSYVGSGDVQRAEAANSFAFRGVSDGEYEILANAYGMSNDADSFISPPRRVTARGADAGGIELKLAPQASIAGKVLVESHPDVCETRREFSIEEAVIALRRDEKTSRAVYQNYTLEVAPDDKGEFTIRRIAPGRYYIEMRLPAENWYLKSIATAPVAAPIARKPASSAVAGRDGFVLKAGEKLSGLNVTIATGAASLSGKVIAAKEGARLPSRLRVHLAPVEAANADDPLRYAEMIVRPDRSFAFNNIAPGKYRLITRAAPDDEPAGRPHAPIAWDDIERAKLRKEAAALKVEIELTPCQRAVEQIIKFAR
jgi:protocatechuate 3,4-dioxygenase beta subunit